MYFFFFKYFFILLRVFLLLGVTLTIFCSFGGDISKLKVWENIVKWYVDFTLGSIINNAINHIFISKLSNNARISVSTNHLIYIYIYEI
jgi:hypothetical protein